MQALCPHCKNWHTASTRKYGQPETPWIGIGPPRLYCKTCKDNFNANKFRSIFTHQSDRQAHNKGKPAWTKRGMSKDEWKQYQKTLALEELKARKEQPLCATPR